jgi:hypothetical protein
MAGMAGLGGKLSSNAFGVLGDKAGMFGANMGLGATVPASQLAPVAVTADTAANASALQAAGPMNVPASGIAGGPGATSITMGGPATAVNPMQAAINSPEFAKQFASSIGNMPAPAMQGAQFTGGLGSRFGQAVRAGLPAGTPGMISKAAPMLAASGVLSNVSSALTPSMGSMGSDGVVDNSYAGPYTAQIREMVATPTKEELISQSGERLYFNNSMPEVYNVQGQVVQPGSSTARGTPILQNVLNPKAKKGQNRYSQIYTPYLTDPNEEGYAGGGEVELADGAFVLDARTVSEIGNGSSNAGLEALRRIGGRPIKGPGDGVSDSIPARIGRDQPARVARDEAIIPADVVKRIGRGNQKRGADKLYALMDKAHKARKKAKRGQDTKVRRGLA